MKIIKNIWLLLGVLLVTTCFTACEDNKDESGSTPIVVSKIYLEDAASKVPDREVTFARLGQLLRIEGSGLAGMRKVYINGLETYFNPAFVTDNSMLVQISKNTPIMDADPSWRNTIQFSKTGTDLVYKFTIRDAAPTISGISHTLPLAGENITIYGTGLTEISKVTFPGNIAVTEGIISDVKGEYAIVKVPDGLTEGGSILVEGSNGGVYSPAYFNCKANVILNFDGQGKQGSWGSSTSMIKTTDLESAVIGTGNVSQGTYCAHRPARITEFAKGKTRLTEVWTAGTGTDNWREQLTSTIPATTTVDKVGFQFDIYVPQQWSNTGFLKLCLINSFNGGEWSNVCYNYVPWIVEKAVVPFKTEGWTTVTIPFSKFYKFAEAIKADATKAVTFDDVLKAREAATYQNFGFYFENSDFKLSNITGNSADATTEYPSSQSTVSVYTDNWRVVSLNTPVYSDFPETTTAQ